MNGLHWLFNNAAQNFSENPAIFGGDRRCLTYSGLTQQIKTIVECLKTSGMGRADRIVTVLENGPEAAVCCFAVSAAAICAPLNPAYSQSEFEFYLRDLAATALITDSQLCAPAVAAANVVGLPVIRLVALENEVAGIFRLEYDNIMRRTGGLSSQAEDVAMLLYTTGSTSRPKMVPITHTSLCHAAQMNVEALALKPDDRCLNMMPLFHIHGLIFAVASSLIAGASVVCAKGFQPARFFEWLEAFQPTWYTAAPTIHDAILRRAATNRESIANSRLRLIRSGASALPPTMMKELEQAFGVPVIEAYAMTETGLIAINQLPPGKRKPGSVGLPIGCELIVMDEQGMPVPAGQTGDVAVRGQGVMRGYECNPQANQQSFFKGWFRTGDQGKLDSDGYLFLAGRRSEIINRGGEKISPWEIDEVLMEHPVVRHAMAFSVPHPRLGEQIAACVILQPHASAFDQERMEFELQEFVAQRLAMFKVPDRIVFVTEFPRGPTNKPQRKSLAAALGLLEAHCSQPTSDPFPARLRSVAEERLAALWKSVLGCGTVEMDDDFFQLGGDSISGAQLIARVGEEFGIDVPLFLLFRIPTLAGLAEWLESRVKRGARDFTVFERTARPENLPLSYAQQRLWFMAQMEGGSRPYHMPMGFHLCGALNVMALRRALNRIIERHEALRTTFAVVKGQPVQRIAEVESSSFQLIEHDLRSWESAEAGLMRLVEEEASAPFNLEDGPLIRGRLMRTGQQQHALLITMHHIVSDGRSLGVLLEELNVLYRAYVEGEEDPLPELKVQYADYAVWQRKWMEGEILKQQAEYWKNLLVGIPGLLELPADYERPIQQDYAGAFVELTLEEELTARLTELSRARGTTIFMTLMAAWAALLGRLSGQHEVVIGTVAANRGRAEIEKLIGCFVNTLAVRVDLSGEPTVAELLERVKVQMLGAQQHQDLPFEYVVELVRPVRSFAHNPLFQVMFAWQNVPTAKLEFPGLEVEELRPADITTKFDLRLSLRPTEKKIIGGATYATSLFERETIERYLGYWRTLLNAMAAGNVQQLVDRLPMLNEQERQQVLYEWNDTDVEYPA